MKRILLKSIAIALILTVMLALFIACSQEQADTPAATEKAATVTIEVDEQEITIENPDGKNIQELLGLAGITLGSEDIVSVDPTKTSGDNMFIQVIRKNTVTIVVAVEDEQSVSYSVSIMGGTVADAIEEAGIALLENYIVSYDLEQPLKNGMEIVISEKEEDTPETTEEATTPVTNPNTPKPTTPKPTTPKPTTPKPTTPTPTQPEPTTPPTSAPTQPAKTVVNVEYYYDCDGSGHGVKVITYSDGTQEEVYF